MARHARIVICAWVALCAGCAASVEPRVQDSAELVLAESQAIPEAELLDIDVRPLRPMPEALGTRLEAIAAGDGILGYKVPTTQSLREAESHYLSRELARRLQSSGQWGLVRVNPYGMSGADLEITGAVLLSDGQSLRLRIEVRDSSGKLWFSRRYTQLAPSDLPQDLLAGPAFPFPDLLNAIANDLVGARPRELADIDASTLRQHSALKFAAELAPAVYAAYRDDQRVLRMPAPNDPVFQRVQEMRLRNETFLDAVQPGYELYVDRIARDYLRFLDQSSQISAQVQEYMQLQGPKRRGQPSELGLYAGNGYRTMLERALADFSRPLEEAVAPLTVEFKDDMTQLNGSVEEQFEQWGTILREMYELDTGLSAE